MCLPECDVTDTSQGPFLEVFVNSKRKSDVVDIKWHNIQSKVSKSSQVVY